MTARRFWNVIMCALALTCLATGSSFAQSATERMKRAADAFMATLDAQQKQKLLFAYDDEQQRKRWSNLPLGLFDRGGLALKELSAGQQAAAMRLVSASLSPKGYQKVLEIMQGDEVKRLGEPEAGPNGPLSFGRDLYYISILGAPSETKPWMLQFGGHHLGVNVTVEGAKGVLTPTFTGAQPSLYTQNGKTVRPLAGESDKAMILLNSLDAAQRAKAVLGFKMGDMVLGPGQDGKTIQTEGLKGSEMSERQRALMIDLISEWAGIIHQEFADARMAQIKAGIADTWFAWSGPIEAPTPGHNITAYYRIQGPRLVIEFAPQTRGGDAALHVHTMYRDPTNDYGRSPPAR